MPDAAGKLTPEDKQKCVDWINSFRQPPLVCPICGSKNWSIADHLVAPPVLGPGSGLQLGGVSYPQLMLISNPCGHTIFVNAVLAGVLQNPAPSVTVPK
jgi:hypothetical protein